MIIFKSKQNGWIVTWEPPRNDFCDQVILLAANAWQDDENMNDWVDGVLVSHIQQKAAGEQAILFLDKFSVHSTDGFKAGMQSVGVQLMPIPAGCTWLLQPVNVGISKPFMDQVNVKFNDWMIELTEADANFGNPSRHEIQQLLYESWEALAEEIV